MIKSNKKLRFRLLLVLALLEACLLTRAWHRDAGAPKPNLGFLLKNGGRYTVAWKVKKEDFQTRDYVRLSDALKFARELGLSEGINPFAEHEMEHAWKDQRRSGNTVVVWKTIRQPQVNQLTFDDETEATFFLKAFQRGSYTPSLFGHSILLVPAQSAFN